MHRRRINGELLPAAAAMLCTFAPPKEDRPSLLTHDEVTTFFHEFGHIIHGLLNEANFDRFSGTNMELDFVEMPS